MSKHSNLAKALYLFAEIQNHLHNGTIRHQLSQIVKHTKDQEILDVCSRAAECLGVELDTNFHKLDENQHLRSIKTIANHLKEAKKKFDEVLKLMPECDSKWVESPLRATEIQLLSLSNYCTLLDKVSDTTDIDGEIIKVGDLVALLCNDEAGRDYEHYGVVVPSSKGFRVAHFFTGETVKSQNSLVEKGFGYIHEVAYEPIWRIKQHLSPTISYTQVEQRIKESRKLEKRVWNKLNYNCEHWAREMVYGQPECTQLKQWREEIRSQKKTIE